mmetsp:Transcript_69991/g.193598  ORF Transcript_69991/g.193598 Transcript_69991/m.193598 type:complete len:135 (+) Transcript_69991:80-484(+)
MRCSVWLAMTAALAPGVRGAWTTPAVQETCAKNPGVDLSSSMLQKSIGMTRLLSAHLEGFQAEDEDALGARDGRGPRGQALFASDGGERQQGPGVVRPGGADADARGQPLPRSAGRAHGGDPERHRERAHPEQR